MTTHVGSQSQHEHIEASVSYCSVLRCACRGPDGLCPSESAPLAPLVLPAGFQADVFAEKVENARSMALGPQGTVFVGSQYVGQSRTPSWILTGTTRPIALW